MSLRRRFASSRRSLAARVGAVATRCFGGFSASPTRSASRAVTSARLRHCDRCRSLDSRSEPDESMRLRSRDRIRSRSSSSRMRESSMFHARSTRVEALFACWPPGPEEVENENSISSSGISRRRLTRTPLVIRVRVERAVPRPSRPEGHRCRSDRRMRSRAR